MRSTDTKSNISNVYVLSDTMCLQRIESLEIKLKKQQANAFNRIKGKEETIAGLKEEARMVKKRYLDLDMRAAEFKRMTESYSERDDLLRLHEGWLTEKEAKIEAMEAEVRGKDLEIARLRSDLAECQGLALDQGRKLGALRSHIQKVRRGVSAFPFFHFWNLTERYRFYTLLPRSYWVSCLILIQAFPLLATLEGGRGAGEGPAPFGGQDVEGGESTTISS